MKKTLCVAIVGLLSGQEQTVSRALRKKVSLRYLPASRVPSVPRGCSHIVLMTKFIGHNWQREAHKALPRERVLLHHGGISGLIALVGGLS